MSGTVHACNYHTGVCVPVVKSYKTVIKFDSILL